MKRDPVVVGGNVIVNGEVCALGLMRLPFRLRGEPPGR